jgi:hypothetical protein
MRSFRFPRSTLFLMSVVLVAVVVAIEKARILSMQLATRSAEAPAVWSALPGIVLGVLAWMCVAGAIGYLFFFLLKRTGLQRFPGIQTWHHRK